MGLEPLIPEIFANSLPCLAPWAGKTRAAQEPWQGHAQVGSTL